MAREKDVRSFVFSHSTQSQVQEIAGLVSDRLPGTHRVKVERVNPITGTPATALPENAPSGSAALIQKALDYVQGQPGAALGYAPNDRSNFVADPYVQRTSGGTAIVHLQQTYRGIPIFQMNRSVQFSDEQTIEKIVGDNVGFFQELDTVPKIDAVGATQIAAEYLSESDENEVVDHWGQASRPRKLSFDPAYTPEVVAKFESPIQSTVLAQGPFGDEIKASLVIFVQSLENLRLAWNLFVTMPEFDGQYRLLIAADRTRDANATADDMVLYCKNVMPSVCTANVFTHNPGQGGRQIVSFPRKLGEYPLTPGAAVALPNPFPSTWWVNKDESAGNCTIAVKGFTMDSLPATVNGVDVAFDPLGAEGDEQKLLNIFYFCNYMHDFLYMLGFDEEAGNFQLVNFSTKGTAGDPVIARAHPGKVTGTANMGTPVDGKSPIMNMGLIVATNRHTAFDSDVVFHEYCHGLSNRLVGGRINDQALEEPQSRGMGEGWSDYFALTIQNHGRPVERTVTGDWVAKRPGGIRLHPYDVNYPGKFGDLGKGDYGPDAAGNVDEHAIGEIWCAALMQMNRNLGAALGSKDKGHELGWQIVVDGLKLSPANPSFIDARDGILKALKDRQSSGKLNLADFKVSYRAAWQAFAQFGMGANATSNGPSMSGVVADSAIPGGV